MTMGDSEIKNLFVRANAQVHIDEARKEKAHQAMMMEMEKQEINKQRIGCPSKIFCFSNFSIWINCFSIFMAALFVWVLFLLRCCNISE